MALPDLSRIQLGSLAPDPLDDLGAWPVPDADYLCRHGHTEDGCARCGDALTDYGFHE